MSVVRNGLGLRFTFDPEPYMGKAIPVQTEDRSGYRRMFERTWKRDRVGTSRAATSVLCLCTERGRQASGRRLPANSCLPQRSVRYVHLTSYHFPTLPLSRHSETPVVLVGATTSSELDVEISTVSGRSLGVCWKVIRAKVHVSSVRITSNATG